MGRESAHTEHTFRSGWTAIIRRHLPMQWLMQQSVERGDLSEAAALLELSEDGRLSGEHGSVALQLERQIITAMFIHPRVVWTEDELPDGYDHADPDRDPLCAVELTDDEIAETLELALAGVAQAERFRVDRLGPDDGTDGTDVGQPPKRARRPAAGKR